MILRKFLTYSDCEACIEQNKAVFKLLYITRDMTARKVAENQNIEYTPNFQKALLRVVGKKGSAWAAPASDQVRRKRKLDLSMPDLHPTPLATGRAGMEGGGGGGGE